MALIDGTRLSAADLATVPRTFATTADRDSYYVTNPTLKVAGARAYIGSGSTMAEYVHNGTAWKLWSMRDASSLIAVNTGGGWSLSALRATVAGGVATVNVSLLRPTTAWGPAMLDSNNGAALTLDASIAGIGGGLLLAPAPALVTSGARWGTFSWKFLTTTVIAVNFDVAIGPYIPAGGWVNGSFSWPIA